MSAVLAVALAGSGRAATPGEFPAPPALPPAHPVSETYYGTTVTDPYRYFEDMQNPTTVQFFKEQNAYTRAVLDRLGPRQQLFERIKALDNAGTIVSDVTIDGQYYFYEKIRPGENSSKLYMSNADASGEKLLVDPDKLAAGGKHYTINYFLPSLDGKYVAYGISEGGSEASVIHVVDTTTGETLPDAIDRAYFVGATSWLPDGKSFYYIRFPKLAPGEPETDKETRAVNYLHVLGRDPDRDVPVFGYGVESSVKFAATDFPIVSYSPASPYVLGIVAHGVKNEVTIYAAPASAVTSANVPWKLVATDDDDVTGFDLKGSTIYLLTHRDAPTFKVIATSLVSPNLSTAKVFVPATKKIVEQISVAQDGLYLRSREGGFGRIAKIALSEDGTPGAATNIALPYDGAVNLLTTDPRVAGATFGLTAWTHSLLYYAVSPNGSLSDTHLKPLSPVDESAYTSSEVQARSADGTLVPMSLIYEKYLKLDGSHPVDMEGYGAYGITEQPSFSTTRVAWMERGGVVAICHVRGGGWFGEDWHEAGMIATKPHTWEDFIACGQWLIQHRYTSRAHLAGEGTSAGGITIGRAITSRPNLFAAALDVVGVSDALRAEFSPNGPPNIPEFGTVKNEEGFHALYAMDAYQHVVNGTAYPAVMLITGFNDPRVPSWELAKFTARLQQASSSGRPILLRVDYDAGHGFLASSRAQSEQLLTDEYAFLLWQCGDPAFASIPKRIVPARSAYSAAGAGRATGTRGERNKKTSGVKRSVIAPKT
ncbi:MAG: S9 family peptidase [Candidatus Eremiobacteraeota bacterium]|nr:S9 family peptidase [Candidatus Eremiobacteraeota bacterium]